MVDELLGTACHNFIETIPINVFFFFYNFQFSLISSVTSFSDGHFNISALHRLEKTTSISMFDKLVPKFLELSSALDFDDSTLNSLKEENNPVEGVKAMLKAWLSGKSSLPPTWKMLLKMFHAIDMGGVAQEIEDFFNSSSVTSLSVSLVSYTPVYQVGIWCIG